MLAMHIEIKYDLCCFLLLSILFSLLILKLWIYSNCMNSVAPLISEVTYTGLKFLMAAILKIDMAAITKA